MSPNRRRGTESAATQQLTATNLLIFVRCPVLIHLQGTPAWSHGAVRPDAMQIKCRRVATLRRLQRFASRRGLAFRDYWGLMRQVRSVIRPHEFMRPAITCATATCSFLRHARRRHRATRVSAVVIILAARIAARWTPCYTYAARVEALRKGRSTAQSASMRSGCLGNTEIVLPVRDLQSRRSKDGLQCFQRSKGS